VSQLKSNVEQVCLDKSIRGIDPASGHKIRLSSSVMMPAAHA
jgi:hypothetical protein